jgi:two-component system copper resistance phosphate regulon response regulator CusR
MKLLVVEDDLRSAQALERSLKQHGFSVDVAMDGPEGLALARERDYDCLVMDVMLPGLDGFSVVTDLRMAGVQTPVIFLTARDALSDRVRGLEIGGGDYLVKPFAFSELLLRINNLSGRPAAATVAEWRIADLTLDPLERRATRAGKRIDLTVQEFAILLLLVRNHGRVVTRARIAEEIWGGADYADPNLIDAAIKRVRKKVDEPSEVKLIQTRRGVGYLLEEGRA